MALLWLVGLVLLGFELWQSGVVPDGAALTLVGGAVAVSVFGGLLIPVLTPLSALTLAVGDAWIGLALWTRATGAMLAARPRRPRLAAGIRDE